MRSASITVRASCAAGAYADEARAGDTQARLSDFRGDLVEQAEVALVLHGHQEQRFAAALFRLWRYLSAATDTTKRRSYTVAKSDRQIPNRQPHRKEGGRLVVDRHHLKPAR